MYKIEKNIPLPGRSGKSWKDKYPFLQMSVGDSFFIPKKHLKNESPHYLPYSSCKKNGYRISVRKERNGFRVWLVEKPKFKGG